MIVRQRRSPKKPLILLISVIIVALWAYIFIFRNNNSVSTRNGNEQQKQTAPEENTVKETKTSPLPNVQEPVDKWVAANSGEYSVVVTDLSTGSELASYRADESYFAASLYKLYVAYLGYLDIQNGEHNFEEPFLGDWNRKECLDKMIRESYSPCAEKLWAEQGKEKSTERIKKYGITDTSMVGLTTTAHDIDVILRRMYEKKELNQANTDLYLQSMKDNIYRDVLPKALPDLIVRDKVGFREQVEYHDVGFVTLPNGREVAITILTTNAGTRRMVDLTKTIFDPLVEASR